MGNKIQIGLLGSGTVGSGVVEVLKKNVKDIEQRVGCEIGIKTVLVRDLAKKRANLEGIKVTDNIDDIINDPEISIVVELMGGLHPALEYMVKAMEAGKHVVTANKDAVAQSGETLFSAAESHKVDFMFEASVGGGIPIITPLKQCLTGNKITSIMGIVNGTTNYMLTKMTQDGSDYDEVLKEAQAKGYAEANPAADVEGLDAARKAAILGSIAFNTRIHLDSVSVEGITTIEAADIAYAKQLNYVIKLLAVAKDYGDKGVNVRVHPVFLPATHPLAAVNDVFNAIFLRGNAIGDAMFYGRGAGSLPTASAVLADIIAVARNIVTGNTAVVSCTCYNQRTLCPLADTESSYYVRLHVDDEPGVLAAIATAFGDSDVSLKSVIQTRMVNNHAEIVAVTHVVKHRKLEKAAELLNGLSVVDKICNIIRVEGD
ncbi:Homoserine dehydrogenase [Anaerovibrio sp. JC8]|uniref:homoserine dehydrogenase n=1 Tax=Anaerovibrio sp. JC8 TaxID=1240085 RepID=UPI000A0C99D8|nr:homoserine dehydrogenase [Anaerovibrio sp. JC8]ORU00282.1 Homoserine dehydrogenase [Anaerovibrio sp. JC8]